MSMMSLLPLPWVTDRLPPMALGPSVPMIPTMSVAPPPWVTEKLPPTVSAVNAAVSPTDGAATAPPLPWVTDTLPVTVRSPEFRRVANRPGHGTAVALGHRHVAAHRAN